MKEYKYDHLIKILLIRDGWLQIPLFKGKERKIEKQNRNVLPLQTVYEGTR